MNDRQMETSRNVVYKRNGKTIGFGQARLVRGYLVLTPSMFQPARNSWSSFIMGFLYREPTFKDMAGTTAYFHSRLTNEVVQVSEVLDTNEPIKDETHGA